MTGKTNVWRWVLQTSLLDEMLWLDLINRHKPKPLYRSVSVRSPGIWAALPSGGARCAAGPVHALTCAAPREQSSTLAEMKAEGEDQTNQRLAEQLAGSETLSDSWLQRRIAPSMQTYINIHKQRRGEQEKKKEWWKKNRTWQRVKQVYLGETCLELLQEISGGTNCDTDAAHIASYNALRKLSITAGPFKVSSLLLFVGLLLLVLLWDQRSSRKKGNI